MTADATTAFVERVRARRVEAGRPDGIDDVSLYRILDGLLAREAIPTEVGTAQALSRSSQTTASNGGRND